MRAVLVAGLLHATLVMGAQASPLLDGGTGSGVCRINVDRQVDLPGSVDLPDVYTGNNPDPVTTKMKAWARHFMQLSSNARASEKARASLKAEMLAVAAAQPLQWPGNWNSGNDRPPSVIYHTMETVFPYIVAYGQNRTLFSTSEHQVIEAWIEPILKRLGNAPHIQKWKTDNKKYQYGAMLAAYGVITGKGGYLKKGVSIYKTGIGGMRKDGSLPGDTERGGNALHYSNLAIANLVAIAEYASDAGIDLYAYNRGGRNLHRAVAFLASSTQNPELMTVYAVNTPAGNGAFAGYSATNLDRRWANSSNVDWGYYYLRRFGNTESGRALLAISPYLRTGRADVSQHAGGNARCYSR